MIRAYRHSLRGKLTLQIAVLVVAILLLLAGSFLVRAYFSARQQISSEALHNASLLATSAEASLVFRTYQDTQEVLDSLRGAPNVVFACVFDSQGEVVARYAGAGYEGEELPGDLQGGDFRGGSRFRPGRVEVLQDVVLDGELLGRLFLRASTGELATRLGQDAFILVFVLGASLVLAFWLGRRIQRTVTDPILNLARTAEQVSRDTDYTVRVRGTAEDEVGLLCDAFNSMLEQIERRDAELAEHRYQLEETVQERTLSLKQRTHELERLNRKLERSNSDLQEFAYIASHDLKEPLRGLHNYSVMLAEDYADKLDEEGLSKLETLQRLSQRLDDLITDLLFFSRVNSAEMSLQRTDLNAVLGDILDSLGPRIEQEGIEVRIPHPLPPVRCDATRVGEVFRNLITNAFKYNDKPERWIEIGFQRAGEVAATEGNEVATPSGRLAPDDLVFFVRDNGIGIPEKHRERVFRIFKRLHGRDRFGGGTGVGLSIVSKIIDRHGGRIWVDSVVGEGTTFFFSLGRNREIREVSAAG